jgi:molecular chaperone DnaK
LGIETQGGIMAKLIQKNTTIPTKASQVFSTAEDNQPAVTVKAYQGERELVQYNKVLGEFNLEGIPPARRGTPQIEITFDIDANGIMHVSAKDKATGKENKITIKSDSGLSKEEIERMIKEAELNADDDIKKRELINMRNIAESQIYNVRNDLKDVSDMLTPEQITKIEECIKEVEETLQGEDSSKITEKVNALSEAYAPITEALAKKNATAKQDDTVVDVEAAPAV